jgi:hypothetical protein
MRKGLKIAFLVVGIPLGAFIVFAIRLEISERSRPDQSYARSIGQSEAGCPDYFARAMAGTAIYNDLPPALGRSPADFRKVAEEQCSKRVPW